MSVARIYRTAKAAKSPGACHRCGKTIEKGEPYIYWYLGFRSHHKNVAHPEHAPRTSELESSKLSAAYAAQETAQDALSALGAESPGDVQDISSIVEEMAEGLREVASEYEEAAEPFGGQGESQDRADALNEAADGLDFQGEDFDEDSVQWCELHTDDAWADSQDKGDDGEAGQAKDVGPARDECHDCVNAQDDAKQEWWGEQISEAETMVADASW